LLIGEMHCF